MGAPLEGLLVLDLSRVLTGPFCSMLLGDLGAEVVKVEVPSQGDDTRLWGPPFIGAESAYFLSVNRNKKSITLDLKKEKARAILLELAKKSDVLLENFRPGVTQRLGVDYDAIKDVNPRIVYCSISSFGQDGPYRDWVAYDLIIQGMGGFMGITGEPDRPPVRIGVAITDIAAGMYAAIAILAALRAREKLGVGQRIDISLLDSTISWMTYMAGYYFATGEAPGRMGSAHPTIVPYQAFETKDEKYINIAPANEKLWRILCDALSLSNLSEDPRFATNAKRVENRKELIILLQKIFLTKTRDEWMKQLIEAGVPCGPIYMVNEAFSDPQVLHRGMLIEMQHPSAGKIKVIGSPMKLSSTPCEVRLPPPLLGQHTKEILRVILGRKEEEIEDLSKEGCI